MEETKIFGVGSPVFAATSAPYSTPRERFATRLTDSSSISTPPSLTSESSPESFAENEDLICNSLSDTEHRGAYTSNLNTASGSGGPTDDALFRDFTAITPSPVSMHMSTSEDQLNAGLPHYFNSLLPTHTESFESEHQQPSDKSEVTENFLMESVMPSQTWAGDENRLGNLVMSPGASTVSASNDMNDHSTAKFENPFPSTSAASSTTKNAAAASSHPSYDMSSIAPAMIEKSENTLSTLSPRSISTTLSSDSTALSLTSVRTIWPDRDNLPPDMKIIVNGVPAVGAKSRVETQIRMRIELVRPVHVDSAHGNSALQYERIGSFSHIKVPPLSGTKRKSKKHQKFNVPPESTLLLEAEVINATPPHSRVYVCNSCRERERKRAHRKKRKTIAQNAHPTEDEMLAMGIDPNAPNALECAAARLEEEERKHAVLFNCGDYVEFSDGEVVLSTRITCYCRHHREKVGFHIVFTLRNYKGDFIATGNTPPIMIMDDHKSVSQSVTANRSTLSSVQEALFSPPRTLDMQQTRIRERPKPYDEAVRRRRLNMRDTPQPSQVPQPLHTSMQTPTPTSPVMSVDSSRMSFSMNERANMAWLNSLSPSSIDEGAGIAMHDAHMSSPVRMTTPQMFPPLNVPVDDRELDLNAPSLPVPCITKLVPVEGPTTGGIEITVLGENFREGIQCVFGDTPSTATRVWAPTTLVCVLPPSFRPGPIIVRLRDPATASFIEPPGNHPLQLFTYVDSTDRALMELALQVVGMQMTGQVVSARDIAMQIMSASQNKSGGSGASTSANSMNGVQARGEPNVSELLSSGLRLNPDAQRFPSVQDSLLGFLKLLDVDLGSNTLHRDPIRACNASGHTLLHLAVMHNFHRLVSDLLRRGCPVNARDVNGYTALHFAALHGWMEVTKLLLQHGADVHDVNNEGLIPIEVAHRSEKIDVERMLAEFADEHTEHAPSDYGDESSEEEVEQDLDGSDEDSDADEWVTFSDMASHARQSSSQVIHDQTRESPNNAHTKRQSSWLQRNLPLFQSWPPWDSDVKSPGPIQSPPPTYDEATTLGGEPGSSKHIGGEKLITNSTSAASYPQAQTSSSRLLSRQKHATTIVDEDNNLDLGLKQLRRGRRNARLAARQRCLGGAERMKDAPQATVASEPVVRTRQGVYDDRMLVWFWIPAMMLAVLVPLLAQRGWFSFNNIWLQGTVTVQ